VAKPGDEARADIKSLLLWTFPWHLLG